MKTELKGMKRLWEEDFATLATKNDIDTLLQNPPSIDTTYLY